jgi:hypothetical protein
MPASLGPSIIGLPRSVLLGGPCSSRRAPSCRGRRGRRRGLRAAARRPSRRDGLRRSVAAVGAARRGAPHRGERPAGGGRPAQAGDPPDFAPGDRGEEIEWTVPSTWRPLPSPSPMRIATYGIAHSPGDAVDAEVSVTRAGGDVDSNVARWAGQFSGSVAPKRDDPGHPSRGPVKTSLKQPGALPRRDASPSEACPRRRRTPERPGDSVPSRAPGPR